MQSIVCCVQSCSVQYAVYSVQCIVCSIQCAVYSVQYAVCSVQCAVCSPAGTQLSCAVAAVRTLFVAASAVPGVLEQPPKLLPLLLLSLAPAPGQDPAPSLAPGCLLLLLLLPFVQLPLLLLPQLLLQLFHLFDSHPHFTIDQKKTTKLYSSSCCYLSSCHFDVASFCHLVTRERKVPGFTFSLPPPRQYVSIANPILGCFSLSPLPLCLSLEQ